MDNNRCSNPNSFIILKIAKPREFSFAIHIKDKGILYTLIGKTGRQKNMKKSDIVGRRALLVYM